MGNDLNKHHPFVERAKAKLVKKADDRIELTPDENGNYAVTPPPPPPPTPPADNEYALGVDPHKGPA